MSTQDELKKKYTDWIKCFNRGIDKMTSMQMDSKEFKGMLDKMQGDVLPLVNKIQKEIEQQGYKMSEAEILEGFKEVEG